MEREIRIWLALALSVVLTCGTQAFAQEKYPSRPIDMIVNFGPGGGADGLGRNVARILEQVVGTQVPASNVAGAAGNTGLTKVANSKADGYTIGTMTGLTVSAWASGLGSMRPKNFTIIAIPQSSVSMFFVAKDSAFKTYKDLLAHVKANPGKVRVATAGLGTLDDLTVRIHGTKGYKMVNVPYAKPAERYISPLGGHTEVLYEEPGDVVQFLESGQLRPLVVFAKKRHPEFKDVPASAEFGHGDMDFPNWRGIVAPANLPPGRLKVLADAMAKVVADPEWKKFCSRTFSCVEPLSPSKAQKFVEEDFRSLSKFMREFGLTKKK